MPILQQKCQECHQPNSIAPMSLRTYSDVRPWTRAIKDRVVSLEMPPWHIDRAVGIQKFKNDRSLSQEQIDTIVRWVDGGAPLGDTADMPPPAEFPNPTAWRLSGRFGEPDLIVASDPYTVAADGQDKWWRSTAETGLTEERWVRAIEIKPSFPGGRKVVHHAIARLQQEEDGVIGLANGFNVDDDIGPGTFMEWAVGEEVVDDVVELGVYFYDQGYVPKYRTILHSMRGHQGGIDIPPGEIGMSQGFTRLKGPARLENFQPHMHMRGKAMSMEAILPDGSRRMLSNVGNFRWNWHINYIYDEEGVEAEKRVGHVTAGGAMDHQSPETSQQEREERHAAPLPWRHPDLAGRQHHDDQAEVGRVEQVPAVHPQQELAGHGDGARCHRQPCQVGSEQQAQRQPGDQRTAGVEPGGGPTVACTDTGSRDRSPASTRSGPPRHRSGAGRRRRPVDS